MTKTFVLQLVERAIKTAAQAALALFTASSFNWMHFDWQAGLGTVATATICSILTSLASIGLGPSDTPSVVSVQATKAP